MRRKFGQQILNINYGVLNLKDNLEKGKTIVYHNKLKKYNGYEWGERKKITPR